MMMESSINSATILPPYEEEFETVDNLHWSPETASICFGYTSFKHRTPYKLPKPQTRITIIIQYKITALKMSLILKHEQKKFEGDGFFSAQTSLIPKVANFVSNNKSLISSEAQALGSVAKAGVNISDAVKKSQELKELQLIRELRNKRLERQALEKQGKGFKIIG
ncbi:hypothetical protein LOTGIDRAFT_164113 [Lottia gigantea]|uniref:Uncharacterized protein n=1 Tax=Lottia gigantea TaxID=225164 RepID=V4AB52_LOTGI|nr:hypothetical protein LOTGIDRAFT_164113 [Lottia gigantea]ESO90526.1 hypothetical protein LOTGIDRAFT_164113 [Lottia gigantea]